MATQPADRGDLKSTSYEFFMLAMAILSIVNLPLLVFFPYESQSWYLVLFIESALTLVFLIDFAYRLKTAPSKRGYFIGQKGYLDLMSCVPALRIFRLFRVLRAVRIVRRLGGSKCVACWSSVSRRTHPAPTSRLRGMRSGGDTSPPPPSATAISTP